MNYFAQKDHETISLGEAYAYATGIVLSTAFIMITFHPYIFYALNESCKLRMACSGLIYRKSLRILKSSAEDGQNGKIINILGSKLNMQKFRCARVTFSLGDLRKALQFKYITQTKIKVILYSLKTILFIF